MSELLLSHSRERHDFIDRSLEAVQQTLALTTVAERLGSWVTPLEQINRDVFVPNVRDGAVSIPKQYQDTEATPCWRSV